MQSDRTLRALGLCAKAGKLICGVPLICEALKNPKKPGLVLEASGISENSSKRLHDRCAYYGVKLVLLEADADALSNAVGKSGRIAAVAVTDENLCRLLNGTVVQEEHNI